MENYSITNYDFTDLSQLIYTELITTYASEVKLIKSISTENLHIDFNYNTDGNLYSWKNKLESITVKPSSTSPIMGLASAPSVPHLISFPLNTGSTDN